MVGTGDTSAVARFDAWAAAMRRRGLARETIRLRRYELASWSAFTADRWRDATWRDVEAWLDGRPIGARTRAAAISHVRAFYRWARREGLATIDPCADVETPKVPKRLPRPARPAAVSRAVGDAESDVELACALMAYAGLRCVEVARLSWDDVDLAADRLYVRGKGSKDRAVPIGRLLRPVLARRDGAVGPVYDRRAPRHSTPAKVSTDVSAHLRSRDCGVTGHQLRHYAATHLLARSGSLMAVRDFLGHASIATTEIYAELAGDEVARAVAAW